MNNSYIGILVNNETFRTIPSGRTGFEHLPFYEEAGKEYGIIPCFLRLQDIVPGERTVRAYVKNKSNHYVKKLVPVPKVIHNRAIFRTVPHNKKIQQLIDGGIIIFNKRNRYSKLEIHELLSQKSEFLPHLPMTMKANQKNILQMLKRCDSLIVKPERGGLGNGVMLINKMEDGYLWTFRNRKTGKYNRTLFGKELPKELARLLSKRPYLVQERISLATFQGNPFDLRVSVQMNGSGRWQVTGMVGKVASDGNYVTNIAMGGKAYPLDILLKKNNLNKAKVYKAVENFSIRAAKRLSAQIEGLSDLGFDIGLTGEGFPMFIECNARDHRITFKNAKLESVWRATHTTPMGYASFLLKNVKG
ncbi:YheC/YheD family protein [Neobacillus notoginsengisoli]|uniref:YheC/YheD family protein n=1 Tax=Neobacillus notoginsengisoli TaxID=1578198 RepID=A0A417YR87_9BACI|nr:YheC/YheD family protein [Neobacillus notoginsengisoli]RHW37365.1 YheC/YheD family protein [Neobacillus notoginsengisoli]